MSQAVFIAAAVKCGEAIEEGNSRIANKQSAVIRKLRKKWKYSFIREIISIRA